MSKERLEELHKFYINGIINVDDLVRELVKLEQLNWALINQNKRYKQVLEFYADEEHYKEKLISEAQYDADGICISNDEYAPPIIYFDSGEKARQELGREENEMR